jgi:hypothetical protein
MQTMRNRLLRALLRRAKACFLISIPRRDKRQLAQ